MSDIFCKKLNKLGKSMKYPPIPGKLGDRIVQSISQEAWDLWLAHQTILINEYRLNLLETEAKNFLLTELEKFLFGNTYKKVGSKGE